MADDKDLESPEAIEARMKKEASEEEGGGGEGEGEGEGGEDTELETRARRNGWRPQDEYRGPEDDWLPAEDFIKKVEEEVPVLRERNRFLSDQLGKQESQLNEQGVKIDEMSSVLTEFNEHNKRSDERAYARAKIDLEAQMATAVEEADTDKYNSAKGQLDQLDEGRLGDNKDAGGAGGDEGKGQAKPPPLTAGEQAFIDDNQHIWRHRGAKNEMITRYGENRNNGMSETAGLKEAKEWTEDQYKPEALGIKKPESRRGDPPAVGKPSGKSRKAAPKRSFDDLPQEAKDICERFERLIPNYKRDQYVKDYDWSSVEGG